MKSISNYYLKKKSHDYKSKIRTKTIQITITIKVFFTINDRKHYENEKLNSAISSSKFYIKDFQHDQTT